MNYSGIRRVYSLLFFFLPFFTTGHSQQIPAGSEVGWSQVKSILATIKAPKFPSKNFSIVNYGAKGDGVTDCSQAFKNDI